MLELPDRYSLLYLLDDKANRIECRRAVSVSGGNPDADFTKGESPDSMLHDQSGDTELLTRLGDDSRELRLSHSRVGRVVDPLDLPAVVVVTDGSEEETHCSSVSCRYFGDERCRVYRTVNKR